MSNTRFWHADAGVKTLGRAISAAKWTWGILVVSFVLYFTVYLILSHAAFETFGYDLGNYSQTLWNTDHGNIMGMTTVPGATSRWAFHFEPILFLFVPIYALLPFPLMLTVLQTIIVAVGALPVFWIARDWLESEWAGVFYAGVYLMLPALQAAVTFDFHGVTLAAAFLAFALWGLLRKRYLAFALWSVLIMSCKEDMPLLVAMMGLYILLVQRQWKIGFATIFVSLAWFILANFVIIPAYSPLGDSIYVARYSSLGGSLEEIIASFFTQPLHVLAVAFEFPKWLYWLRLTMPLAFTSLLDPFVLLLCLPSVAINTLSHSSLTYAPDVFHYTAPIAPFVVISSITGVAWLSRRLAGDDPSRRSAWRVRLLIIVFGASLGYHVLVGYTPLRMGFHWPAPDTHDRLAGQMLEHIPSQAAVSATNSLVPRLANRSYIYIFPKVEDAEYIAIDTQSSYYPFDDREELCRATRQLVVEEAYGVVYARQGLFLLQRGVPDKVEMSVAGVCSQ